MKRNHVLLISMVNLLITSGLILLVLAKIKKVEVYNVAPSSPFSFAKNYQRVGAPDEMVDLSEAAKIALSSVVQIRAKFSSEKDTTKNSGVDDLVTDLTGINPNQPADSRASGSGVVISEDGYIITNEHVLANAKGNIANEVEVISRNNKVFRAKLVGHDATTDLAVLKIDASNLPYLVYCNTKTIEPGQWVLAAGYPLSRNAIVTAGIVSARGIKIVKRIGNKNTVQSFIQTDAAANSGNSGGPLVNADGELVGVMTGIVTSSGSYSGYSFAIPVNIVKRVVEEIMKK